MVKKNPNNSTKYVPYNDHCENSIPPEDIQLKTQYAFTISPHPGDLIGVLPIDMNETKKYLDKMANCHDIKFFMYPELSKKGKLHFHGTVMFESYTGVFDFYQMLHAFGCQYKLDTISDLVIWLEYCTKGHRYMEPQCERRLYDYPFTHNSER